MKLVPRQPGDTSPPLPQPVADALRKAGQDPAKFALAPGETGELGAHLGLPPAGSSVEHIFLFTDRADALRCVETFADRGGPVTIAKDAQGWWLTIAGAAADGSDDADAHTRMAAEVAALGGQDRGKGRITITTKLRVK